MFDIDLAPYYYGFKIRDSHIVEKIVVKNIEIRPSISGYEAVCYLDPKIKVNIPEYSLHVSAAGVGSSHSKQTAIYKSISEALERWAYSSENRFNSTAGFAAYPSLLGSYAKEKSKAEIIERYCLKILNDESLNLSKMNDSSFLAKVGRYHFVLVNSNCQKAYGFSCQLDLKRAVESAEIEMYRNLRTIQAVKGEVLSNLQERRLIYFSEGGRELIQRKIESCLALEKENNLPEINTERVEGPWSKFTKVYHSNLVENIELNNNKLEYFYF